MSSTSSTKANAAPTCFIAHIDINSLCSWNPQLVDDEKHYEEQKPFHSSLPGKHV